MRNPRRKLLKALTLGGGTVTIAKLPHQWTTPVVDSVMLPAHGQTTGAPTPPTIVRAGGEGATEPINAFNAPGISDVLGRPAHALNGFYTISFCIVVNLLLKTYDAFVIVNDEFDYPSYRGTGLPLDPANNVDSNLTYDVNCNGNTSALDTLVNRAHANALGVSIRVFDVQGNGAMVEIEVEGSRLETFVEWNDFSCGLSCGELSLPEVVISDRKIKDRFEPVDEQAILERVASMPVEYWNYTDREPGVRHIGPMAQDFHSAFDVGDSDRHIHMVDANGVNLASIKALYRRLEEKDAKISRLEEELRLIKERLGLS